MAEHGRQRELEYQLDRQIDDVLADAGRLA